MQRTPRSHLGCILNTTGAGSLIRSIVRPLHTRMFQKLTKAIWETWFFWPFFLVVGFMTGRQTDTSRIPPRADLLISLTFALVIAFWVVMDARRRGLRFSCACVFHLADLRPDLSFPDARHTSVLEPVRIRCDVSCHCWYRSWYRRHDDMRQLHTTRPNQSAAAKPVDRFSFRFAVHVC